MAIKKIALPEGTTLDINDARVVSDAIAYVGDSEGTATYVDGGQVIDVTTKADKVTNATNGNFAGLDANGNLVDSGHKHSDYLTSFTETDPVFAASAAHGISTSDISGWNSKLTGVTFNNVAATVTGGVAAITATIPSAPGTLKTNNSMAQTTSSSESLTGTINLHKVAKTGTYSDLIGTPSIPSAPGTLNTNNSTAQTASSSESLSGTINLHKVSKTGNYSDLIGTPSIPSAPGTLNTNNTSAQTASSSEALSGSINLHKVAKTGTYSDLIGAPNITISTSEPTSSQGSNGDIWIVV